MFLSKEQLQGHDVKVNGDLLTSRRSAKKCKARLSNHHLCQVDPKF